jgi:hypothetical protein
VRLSRSLEAPCRAQIIGQAYVVAHNLAKENQEALGPHRDVLMEKKEIFGDELLDLLDSVGFASPTRLWRRGRLAAAVLRGHERRRRPKESRPSEREASSGDR